MIRRVERVIGARSPVGPGRVWIAGLVLVLLVLVAVSLAARRALLGTGDAAGALADAALLTPDRLRLPTPLDVAWTRSLDVADAAGANWNHLLRTPLPPPLCVPNGAGADGQRINLAVRGLDRALDRADLQPLLLDRSLAELGEQKGTTALEAFILDYNAARALLATGDPSAAARILDAQLDGGFVGDASVPHTRGGEAAYRLQQGQTSAERATLAYHTRILAGSAALRRGAPYDAILHLRRGLNALHYVIAAGESADVRGHYQRVVLEPGRFGCGGTTAEPLTSMDGYAALVLAYLETEDFRNPRLVRGEVSRGPYDMEASDPLAPLLRYAQRRALDLGDGPIPPNFVWAASNLQRIYHHNRRAPDTRLEVARAVLVFRIASNGSWLQALAPFGNADGCGMLHRLTEELATTAERTLYRRGAGPAAPDSALAAVGVLAFARTRAECGAMTVPVPPDDVRSEWLLLSGRYLGGGLISDYERRRVAMQRSLAQRNATPRAMAEHLGPPLERTDEHLAVFRGGRNPPELPARVDPEHGRRLVESWRRGLFRDAANALLAGARGEAGGRQPMRLTTDQFPRFLRTLNATIRHAGLTPADLYPYSEFADLARSGGRGAWIRYGLEYRARSSPVLTTLVLLGLLAAAILAVVYAHVNVWRLRLLTRRRFYADGLE